jgi:hypothetical protein
MIAKLLESVGPGKGGRKVNALDKTLAFLAVVTGLAWWDQGLSENELDSILTTLGIILATFTTGNMGEHWTKKGTQATPVQAQEAA